MKENDNESPLTERRNPASYGLDKMNALEITTLMNQEDENAIRAVRNASPEIAKAMELFAMVYQAGGRIAYMGAGSSGRYGILDMVELMPTFGVDPNQFIGLLAGGKEAMFRAQENSEDSLAGAEKDIGSIPFQKGDLLIGIAASGRTPYVIRGLEIAQRKGMHTISISSTENDLVSPYAEISIHLLCGPEVLTGSTRLKAGTAEKMALNIISTGAMVLSGKVYQNLMVDLLPSNAKLHDRSIRIVMEAASCSREKAEDTLRKCGYHPKEAIVMIRLSCSREEAQKALKEAGGFVDKAIHH